MWTLRMIIFKPFSVLDCKNSITNATSKAQVFPSEKERRNSKFYDIFSEEEQRLLNLIVLFFFKILIGCKPLSPEENGSIRTESLNTVCTCCCQRGDYKFLPEEKGSTLLGLPTLLPTLGQCLLPGSGIGTLSDPRLCMDFLIPAAGIHGYHYGI